MIQSLAKNAFLEIYEELNFVYHKPKFSGLQVVVAFFLKTNLVRWLKKRQTNKFE